LDFFSYFSDFFNNQSGLWVRFVDHAYLILNQNPFHGLVLITPLSPSDHANSDHFGQVFRSKANEKIRAIWEKQKIFIN